MRLEPADESNHPAGSEQHFNESVYFNLFDPGAELGAWLRIGNRPNEGYAEVTVCVYLPDGRVAFTFSRPAIHDSRSRRLHRIRWSPCCRAIIRSLPRGASSLPICSICR